LRKYLPVVESSGLSHIGPVRPDNQDSIYLADAPHHPEAGQLFVVADGMGGYTHGALASSLAIEKLIEALPGEDRKVRPKNLLRGVEFANLAVYKTAQRMGAGRMGTTLTAAYIRENDLHIVHVGDSRAYLIRERQAFCLTSDHTVVGDMVRMKLISADKVRDHHQRSILTKAVGIGMFLKPDISHYKLQETDHLILCSDGVWSVVCDEEFAEVVSESSGIDQISRNLVDLALARATDDNASVIAIHIRELLPVVPEKQEKTRVNWFGNRRKSAR
jgi:serine/threonine protein phosphatase PrpC